MKTLGDMVIDAYKNYIAPTKAETSTKEKRLVGSGKWGDENKRQGYERLSPRKRREIANESPLLMKGVRKKSLDTFRAWFEIETDDGHGTPVKADVVAFRRFEERTQFMKKLYEARVASHIYGDGFILISFTNDKGNALSTQPSPRAEPVQLYVMNSEYINDMTPDGDYIYRKGADEMVIHKDRIIHITANKIPGFKLGVSTIDLLRWTMFSKKNIDMAAGHILAWHAHGLVDLTWENMGEEEKKMAEQILNAHPGSFYHDQDVTIDVKNPTAIDPKPFYDYVVLNIAGALNMPVHVLTGIQTGRVTGSEIGFADYYRDVRDEQDIEFTPLIIDLYSRILRARGRKWKYRINWNPIYIDEMSEAKLLETKINAAEKALNGTKGAGGFIDKEEARMIFNKGQIVIDVQKKIKSPPLPKPDVPRPNPVQPPQPPKSNQEMIDRWKEYKKKEIDKLEETVDDNV